jgi:hypothetical protein
VLLDLINETSSLELNTGLRTGLGDLEPVSGGPRLGNACELDRAGVWGCKASRYLLVMLPWARGEYLFEESKVFSVPGYPLGSFLADGLSPVREYLCSMVSDAWKAPHNAIK